MKKFEGLNFLLHFCFILSSIVMLVGAIIPNGFTYSILGTILTCVFLSLILIEKNNKGVKYGNE